MKRVVLRKNRPFSPLLLCHPFIEVVCVVHHKNRFLLTANTTPLLSVGLKPPHFNNIISSIQTSSEITMIRIIFNSVHSGISNSTFIDIVHWEAWHQGQKALSQQQQNTSITEHLNWTYRTTAPYRHLEETKPSWILSDEEPAQSQSRKSLFLSPNRDQQLDSYVETKTVLDPT